MRCLAAGSFAMFDVTRPRIPSQTRGTLAMKVGFSFAMSAPRVRMQL